MWWTVRHLDKFKAGDADSAIEISHAEANSSIDLRLDLVEMEPVIAEKIQFASVDLRQDVQEYLPETNFGQKVRLSYGFLKVLQFCRSFGTNLR